MNDARVRAFLGLEDAVCDARNMAWIAAHLEAEFTQHVSRDRPGRISIEMDETASDALTWSIYEANRRVAVLFDAFFEAIKA